MILEQQSTSDSGMIKKCFYNFTSNQLKIEFNNGQVYEYSNVPSEIYESLIKAESQGKFFNEQIKQNYQFSQLISD
jgi:hypothetical protein